MFHQNLSPHGIFTGGCTTVPDTVPVSSFLHSTRLFLAAVACSLATYLDPVRNAFAVLLLLAAVDIFFGMTAGIIRQKEGMSLRKFCAALAQVAVYLLVIVLIYAVGWFQGDTDESLTIVKTITYVFIYFLGGNILKNLSRLFPSNDAIVFLHRFLSLEFTRRFSAVTKNHKNGDNDENRG